MMDPILEWPPAPVGHSVWYQDVTLFFMVAKSLSSQKLLQLDPITSVWPFIRMDQWHNQLDFLIQDVLRPFQRGFPWWLISIFINPYWLSPLKVYVWEADFSCLQQCYHNIGVVKGVSCWAFHPPVTPSFVSSWYFFSSLCRPLEICSWVVSWSILRWWWSVSHVILLHCAGCWSISFSCFLPDILRYAWLINSSGE